MKNHLLFVFQIHLQLDFETLAALNILYLLIMLSFLINYFEYYILFLLILILIIIHFFSFNYRISESNLGELGDFKCFEESNLERLVFIRTFILIRVNFNVIVVSLKILAINLLRNLYLDHIIHLIFHSLNS